MEDYGRWKKPCVTQSYCVFKTDFGAAILLNLKSLKLIKNIMLQGYFLKIKRSYPVLNSWTQMMVQAEKDLRMSTVKLPAQERIRHEIRPGC